jgi:magnesium transporter
MLKYVYYKNQDRSCRRGQDLSYKIPVGKDFVWLLMERPSEKEVTKVCRDFSLQKRHFEFYKNEKRSARYSVDPLVFVFMDYYLENDKIKNSHILFILKENALIIVLPTITAFHNELFDRLATSIEANRVKNLGQLMYQFMLDDVNENYDVLDKVDHLITELDKKVIGGKGDASLLAVVKLKRRIHMMARRFWGSAKIIFVIRKGLGPLKVDTENMHLLDDVYDTYMHQVDILASYKDMLTDILTIHTTKASNDMNMIIKRLTALTVILMVPNLIASMYGMNFDEIPLLHNGFGFFMSFCMMVTSIILLYVFFHKKKWI